MMNWKWCLICFLTGGFCVLSDSVEFHKIIPAGVLFVVGFIIFGGFFFFLRPKRPEEHLAAYFAKRVIFACFSYLFSVLAACAASLAIFGFGDGFMD
ncbi:MAG: hypothetical protein LBD14_06285 [Puniceicoccales bacterium]|nr:hypothetical protein [Puniceicoccales bacterium]